MIKRRAVLLEALIVVAALCVGAWLSGLSPTPPAQAQATKSQEARKWEYCAIFGVNRDPKRNSSSATIGTLTATGLRFETLDGGSSADPLGIAFAKLGLEGWEFVGQVAYSAQVEFRPDSWLFKRPVP